MKKIPLIFLGTTALVFAMSGCKTSTPKAVVDSLATDSVDTLAAAIAPDTLSTEDFTYAYYNADSTVQSTIYVDYPQGNDSLSLAVKAFVGKQLGNLYVPYHFAEEEEALRDYPRYKGSMLQAQKMLDYYGKGAAKFLSAQQSEMSEEYKPHVCSDVKIRKVAETSTYLTYLMSSYYEVGGAHGSYTSYQLNISKLTNKPIEKAIDASKTRALQKILKKGVEHYFKECGDENFDISTIYEYLDPMGKKNNANMIPLPANTPYIENDSLCFVYQQYEIAPYAAGLVSFNVALKDIKPYLRKEVSDLIGDTQR